MNIKEMKQAIHKAAIEHDGRGKLYEFFALIITGPALSSKSVKGIYSDMKSLGRVKEA